MCVVCQRWQEAVEDITEDGGTTVRPTTVNTLLTVDAKETETTSNPRATVSGNAGRVDVRLFYHFSYVHVYATLISNIYNCSTGFAFKIQWHLLKNYILIFFRPTLRMMAFYLSSIHNT